MGRGPGVPRSRPRWARVGHRSAGGIGACAVLGVLLMMGTAGCNLRADAPDDSAADLSLHVMTGNDRSAGAPSSEDSLHDTAVEPGAADSGPAEERGSPPEHQRGVYLTAWVAGSATRLEELIGLARRTEVNTFVIDVKDASGFVSHRTSVALAREIGADRDVRIRDVEGLLSRLESEGIWPIARIVVFQDPVLARARPDMAVQDVQGGPWVDGRGDVWVNPWDERVWSYHAELAREVIELGFREIQWDYIRFPDRPSADLARAVFPGADGRPRTEAVRGFLQYTRARLADLEVPLTADVFGVTTSATHDVGIGQVWESFIDLVDVALPMVYPSHWARGSFGHENPNAHPYEIVQASLRNALRRSGGIEGAGRIIPWLQAFTLGSPPYGPEEIRAQIRAVYDLGLTEWMLWNPSSRYQEAALEPAPR